MKKGKYFPCSVSKRTLCSKKVISSSTLKSQQTNKFYTIFHEANCYSTYVIYLMDCTLCKKPCIGKSETNFNTRRKHDRKGVKIPDSILACRHFQEKDYSSNKPAKFILIDQLTNTTKTKDTKD